MARQSAGPKAQRALDLLTGLYAPAVRERLEAYGLSEDELSRGWRLLEQYARARRGPELPMLGQRAAQRRLDRWENRWFVIADAALSGAFPELHAWLFRGLSRQSGLQVVLYVELLLDRLDQLETPPKQYRREAPLARARLVARGLTREVMLEGRQLIAEAKRSMPLDAVPSRARRSRSNDSAGANAKGRARLAASGAPGATSTVEAAAQGQEEAEAALWRWYLEWSRIARAVIEEPLLLAHLGFSRPGRPRKASPSPDAKPARAGE